MEMENEYCSVKSQKVKDYGLLRSKAFRITPDCRVLCSPGY